MLYGFYGRGNRGHAGAVGLLSQKSIRYKHVFRDVRSLHIRRSEDLRGYEHGRPGDDPAQFYTIIPAGDVGRVNGFSVLCEHDRREV